jgi:hypothetical protein
MVGSDYESNVVGYHEFNDWFLFDGRLYEVRESMAQQWSRHQDKFQAL